MKPPEPPYSREIVEYFGMSQQPDGSWESCTGYYQDIDYARKRIAVRRQWTIDLGYEMPIKLARRVTTVSVEFVQEDS
jgi:hypothetical protein